MVRKLPPSSRSLFSATAGALNRATGYLEQLAELAKQHGALLIFDEVITGFRRDIGGAQSYYNVIPIWLRWERPLVAGCP